MIRNPKINSSKYVPSHAYVHVHDDLISCLSSSSCCMTMKRDNGMNMEIDCDIQGFECQISDIIKSLIWYLTKRLDAVWYCRIRYKTQYYIGLRAHLQMPRAQVQISHLPPVGMKCVTIFTYRDVIVFIWRNKQFVLPALPTNTQYNHSLEASHTKFPMQRSGVGWRRMGELWGIRSSWDVPPSCFPL
jgi:hypothetical protein